MSWSDQEGLEPEAVAVASAALARSWQFVERDPVLEGQDREVLQAELARRILASIRDGDRDLIPIANRAIRGVRERVARKRSGIA